MRQGNGFLAACSAVGCGLGGRRFSKGGGTTDATFWAMEQIKGLWHRLGNGLNKSVLPSYGVVLLLAIWGFSKAKTQL